MNPFKSLARIADSLDAIVELLQRITQSIETMRG